MQVRSIPVRGQRREHGGGCRRAFVLPGATAASVLPSRRGDGCVCRRASSSRASCAGCPRACTRARCSTATAAPPVCSLPLPSPGTALCPASVRARRRRRSMHGAPASHARERLTWCMTRCLPCHSGSRQRVALRAQRQLVARRHDGQPRYRGLRRHHVLSSPRWRDAPRAGRVAPTLGITPQCTRRRHNEARAAGRACEGAQHAGASHAHRASDFRTARDRGTVQVNHHTLQTTSAPRTSGGAARGAAPRPLRPRL